jgi:hypothetical protein
MSNIFLLQVKVHVHRAKPLLNSWMGYEEDI